MNLLVLDVPTTSLGMTRVVGILHPAVSLNYTPSSFEKAAMLHFQPFARAEHAMLTLVQESGEFVLHTLVCFPGPEDLYVAYAWARPSMGALQRFMELRQAGQPIQFGLGIEPQANQMLVLPNHGWRCQVPALMSYGAMAEQFRSIVDRTMLRVPIPPTLERLFSS